MKIKNAYCKPCDLWFADDELIEYTQDGWPVCPECGTVFPKISVAGIVTGIDTSAYEVGDTLYLSHDNPDGWMTKEPKA